MRIGVVTFWKNNYGSTLQAYATKYYLTNLGYEVNILNERYTGVYRYLHFISKNIQKAFYTLRHKGAVKYHCNLRKNKNQDSGGLTKESSKAIDHFIRRYLNPYECSYKKLKEYAWNDLTALVFAGSDQIWNCSKGIVSPYYFLKFVPKYKRVALSASFGSGNVPTFLKKEIGKAIKEFSKISVRENDGVEIVKELSQKTVLRLADPTILLTGNEWRSFAGNISTYDSPYVLIHFIDNPSDLARKAILEMCKSKKCQVVCLGYKHDFYNEISHSIFVDGGPEEYISLIDHADIVLTDSFHSAMFSINLESNFIVFKRQYSLGIDQSSRLSNMLKFYDYENHFITDESQLDSLKELTIHDVTSLLENERNELIRYINASLPSLNCKNGLRGKTECTGCGACVVSCNKNAIKLEEDHYGFVYPIIDDSKCISCGKCTSVCKKSTKRNIKPYTKKAYVFASSDIEIRKHSASGGAFTSIAAKVITSGGVVCGANMRFQNGSTVVEHILIDKISDLYLISGSKYVQSKCYHVFPIIKEMLKERFVLFGGTSCQINALYNYLGNHNIANLLTIDLVCHGVPSLAFFQDYIRFLEDKNGGSIIDFSFRRKEEKTIAYTETVIFDDNGKKKIISVPSGSSSYYKLFLLGESYREACYHCNYSSINKPADITIGDYFELKQDYPDIFKKINSINGCGVSCIITNNMIGEKWINAMKNDAYIFEVDVKTVHYSHAQLCGPMKYSPLRNKIFKMYYRNGYKSVANYFYYQNIVRAFPRMVKKKLLGFRRKK